MKNKTPALLYFYYKRSSFVARDIQSLSHHYKVIEFQFDLRKHYLFTDLFRQLLFLVKNWKTARTYICFFSGYHSFLPSLFSKLFNSNCLIIAGGTDCVCFPDFNYGNLLRQPLKFFTCASFRMASCISPVHERLIFYPYTYDTVQPKTQGIKAHCKGIKTRMETIYNGYDFSYFKPEGEKKPASFLTVTYGIGLNYINFLKGIDLILQLAPSFPECTFSLVGQLADDFPFPVPPNVILYPESTQDQLLTHYQENEYYLQLSLSEGFPNSLSEAMLCGCIPVGSDVGGIPDIIGDTGFILFKKDIEALKILIRTALASDTRKLSQQARAKIMNNYSEERRTKALVNLVKSFG
ncbi:MAG: glycosyltransferase family 4 protein [Bacteroidales bacterium]